MDFHFPAAFYFFALCKNCTLFLHNFYTKKGTSLQLRIIIKKKGAYFMSKTSNVYANLVIFHQELLYLSRDIVESSEIN